MTETVHYHLGGFPPPKLDWEQLVPLIGQANAGLARYDGLLTAIPNAAVLLSPLITQEAVLSSKIEGTHVTMGEVLELEAGGEPHDVSQPKRDDAEEIVNYRTALRACVDSLRDQPLTQHLLRQAHALLMQGVRGKDKSPGQFRNTQNWIGPKGCPIEEASFVPIAPEHLGAGMDYWEAYMIGADALDPLVQLALVHLEFEALHPFEDGNGRLGRMLIPLFLFTKEVLSSPDFYMSGYLEAHRDEYQERMRAASRDSAWTEWCAFFLTGIVEQSTENEEKARNILTLYEWVKNKVVELTHSQHSIRAVDFLFQQPIFKAPDFIRESGIPRPTAQRILAVLRDDGLLRTLRPGKGRRPGIYAFSDLINYAEGARVL
ncbi:MAG: Fic family protein [Gammaproteobacteria bacterium]